MKIFKMKPARRYHSLGFYRSLWYVHKFQYLSNGRKHTLISRLTQQRASPTTVTHIYPYSVLTSLTASKRIKIQYTTDKDRFHRACIAYALRRPLRPTPLANQHFTNKFNLQLRRSLTNIGCQENVIGERSGSNPSVPSSGDPPWKV